MYLTPRDSSIPKCYRRSIGAVASAPPVACSPREEWDYFEGVLGSGFGSSSLTRASALAKEALTVMSSAEH